MRFDMPALSSELTLRWALASLLVAVTILATAGCARGEDPVVVDRPTDASRPETPTPSPAAPDLGALEVDLEPVADGFEQPLLALGAGDGTGAVYVAEKTGKLYVLREGERSVFLDLSDSVSTESERGLLGVAFPGQFAQDGRFYASYTDSDGASTISRFSLGEGGVADRDSEELIIRVPQPYANHNGGHIVFGPDGYLYTSFGDGGSAGDPLDSGQDTSTLLGAMLRIDVGEGPLGNDRVRTLPYAIPEDNPFVGSDEALDEIWSYGLRNPWRFSFDRETGDLWIADVGQNEVEEVNFQPADSGGGENWGWNLFEGTSPYPPDREVTEDREQFAWPIVEYRHPIGRSITGGYVYRGGTYPALQGVYLYGDYVSGRIWGLVRAEDGSAENRELLETDLAVVSFGEDDDGELLVVDFGGALYRVTAR